ncbi:putative peroxisomal membrane protein receptor Pex19 [Aspergillus brunneoviolaceus CBS 621.78]|uniref:Pex19-domain-containing protein n=1 Tax=Aspergillus brunneoviolaceus CBS 621.78 TaxID=1450534 RepID=A0ACD1GFY9_9EURO|nr:Pex19-domain-containing protein [Aspergillus brunneoviolaceus CBS 621.78]RAH48034.1 Pex19-domain-containing protein [Aspergillus brunneoviolaceus CBS 621.78]
MSSSHPSKADTSPAQTQSTATEHDAQTPSSPSTNPAETTTTTTIPTSTTTSSTAQPAQPANNDEDDSDFDELDDVLDNFNKPAASTTTTQPPSSATATATAAAPATEDVDLDEEAFLKQLEKDMANLMGAGAGAGDASAAGGMSEGFGDEESLDKDAEMFAKLLEEGGVSAEDFLKQLVGDMMKGEAGGAKGTSATKSAPAPAPAATDAAAAAAAAAAATATATPETFNDTIQRTIERMKESGDKATAAAEEEDDGDDADDLVAQLIKAIEAGAGGDGDDADLTKMFQGMMEQLSNKEILYEPMKELDTKFGPWLAENKASGKVSDAELQRYEKQAGVVAQIVAKFEEQAYTDEDPKCREYVWEKMQEMQACGNPPDELIPAPMMEDLMGGGAGAGAGVPDCPQQ